MEQLRRFVAFAACNCNMWSLGDQPKLGASTLNFLHLNEFLILPASEEEDCSAVELVSDKPQSPLLFISHWWGELLRDFMDCLGCYRSTKELREDSFMWICAFAERQHSLQQRLTVDAQCSFLGALTRSDHVLLMLGSDMELCGPGPFFSRAWCLLEVGRAMELKKVIDYAAVTVDGPQVLVESILDQVGQMEKKTPRSTARSMQLRETTFPIEVLASGLQLDIQTAQTSSKADHERILKCIAGHRPDYVLQLGDARHFQEEFRKFNARLRSEVALAVWFQAVQSQMDTKRLARALIGDEARTSLMKNFAHGAGFEDRHLAILAAALPGHLRHLELSFWMCTAIGSPGLRAFCKTLPQLKQLETLTLDFQLCSKIGQTGIDALGLCLPATIVSLNLNFERTHIRSVFVLAKGIASLKNLRVLGLDFGGIDNIDDRQVSAISECLPPRLINLHLALRGCPYFTTLGVHSLVLGFPPEMSMLSLNFSSCDRINNDAVKWLAHKLPRMLKVLRVDLSDTLVDDTAAMLLLQRLPSALQGAKISLNNTLVSPSVQRACRKLETIRQMLVDGAMRSQPTEKLAIARRIRRKSPAKRSGTTTIDTSEFNFASPTFSSKAHFTPSLGFGDASVGPSIRFLLSLTNKTKGSGNAYLNTTIGSGWASESAVMQGERTLPPMRCQTSP
ncbi:RpII140, partial [Symbiodinium natans]